MQLINEKNDLALRVLNFLQDSFQTIFELAAIFRAREHRAEIQSNEPFVAKRFGDVARNNSLSEPFYDCRFADAGFANQDRIVLRASRQHLDRSTNFIITTNNRIEFSLSREIREVASVLCQCLVIRFRIWIGDAHAAARLLDRFQQIIACDAMLPQNLARVALLLVGYRNQQMFGRDVLVLHRLSLFLRRREDLVQART